ncbi:MAG: RNA pseudouridine synthase [Saprospiraceae bacterium]|nr:RNA pseudouridine synthase [Saprospiraceae bacterium]
MTNLATASLEHIVFLRRMEKENTYQHALIWSGPDPLPLSINYPHNYTPHPIALKAAEDLIPKIEQILSPLHNFGLNGDGTGLGKMFGILVVEDEEGKLSYLAAFSGKLDSGNHAAGFVPPVFDTLHPEQFYLDGEAEIVKVNEAILSLENSTEYLDIKAAIQSAEEQSSIEIKELKDLISTNKLTRKLSRNSGAKDEESLTSLDHQSAREHFQLKDLKRQWKERIDLLYAQKAILEEKVNALKIKRKSMSNQLQARLFDSYAFTNYLGESKSLLDLFDLQPPSGAGECAAPKLFQYAFTHGLKPIAMAEFWFGRSPSSEVRRHLLYYPACRGKCEPILGHMLQGLSVDPDPLADPEFSSALELKVLYEDDELIIINKPDNLLSVPGKEITDSVKTRVEKRYPEIEGPVVVHRLDMSTSGILLIAKNAEAHKILQKQFEDRTIQKTYLAVLDGVVETANGKINLPLRVDLDDRPRQMVCYEYGKEAVTYYQVIGIEHGKTRIRFFPHTGRTHQLRVHAAHQLGLNTPIVGDDLYGSKAGRLHLHAEKISFNHPGTNERINIHCPADF